MTIENFHYNSLLTVLLLAVLFSSSCNNTGDKHFDFQKKSLTEHIGDTFQIQNVLDSSGNHVELDFSKSDLTIIDFCFNECPPCTNEMKQFSEVLADKEGKISVISISINQFWCWKPTLSTHIIFLVQ